MKRRYTVSVRITVDADDFDDATKEVKEGLEKGSFVSYKVGAIETKTEERKN